MVTIIPVLYLSIIGRVSAVRLWSGPCLYAFHAAITPGFAGDTDPHGEHDFGAFAVDGVKCIFKFDYYDLQLENGSEDPNDPTKTCLIPTLLLAEHY